MPCGTGCSRWSRSAARRRSRSTRWSSWCRRGSPPPIRPPGKIRALSQAPTASPEPRGPVRAFDVIAFPIIDWTFRFQRPQQLLSRFAADGHRVYYLRTAFLGLDRDPRVSPLSRNVFDLALPGEADLDLYAGRLEGETLHQTDEALQRVCAEEGIEDAVLFVQYPFWEPLARRLRERRGWRLVYDCLDEHSGFGTHGPSTAEDERRLIAEADLVLATSAPLLERIRAARPDAMRLPNAGDAERFAALPPRASSPLAALPRPVIGYYGAIASWFDVDAVSVAASRHGAWSFALVGDTRGTAPDALAALEARPNVRLHGEVPYDELPRWAAGFDVCTIPFRKTPLTEATNPVKLYEYLATGKPIVARRLPELEPFEDLVVLYDRAEDLGPALERALSEIGEDRARRRRETARANTWETRYAALRERLDAVPRPEAAAASAEVAPGPPDDALARAGHAIAVRAREIRRLDAVLREREEGIAYLKGELAVRDRTIAVLRAESEARGGHLEAALAEIQRLEKSIGWTPRVLLARAKRAAGVATAPGTPLFQIGSRLLPRPVARWLRRRLAPVPPSTGLVEAAPARGRARASDALPETPSGRYDVVVLSIIDWDFRFQRPQQLATQFGRHGHRVLYLSTTQFLTPHGPAWDLIRKAERVAELRIRSRRALNIYSGTIEPADLDALTAAFQELARDLCVGDAVCVVEIPFWAPLAERLRDRLGWRVAYDCMDEWTNFPGFGAGVLALEESLVKNADATIVSADRLLEKWKGTAPRLILAKNGMDADHYRAGFGPNELLGAVRHPVIGYYGALASWVDVPLLTRMAREHPDATIVLAGGKFDVDLSPVEALPNVRLLGQRPYAEMPRLLWHFDACVIPFLVNDITEATNPVKFYEYLFGGKPVVAPALTELLPYAGLCYLARGHDEFLAQLSRALAEPPDDPRRAARRRLAEENDWAHRYSAIHEGLTEAHPLVSVVVVTYGGLELTKACLESLLERETWPRLEAIVVDNASDDGTPEYLRALASRHARLRVVCNAENRGFAAANNQGIALARGELVVLLNNDTVVPPGLLRRLVGHLRRDPSIGLLCPTTNFCGNEALVEPDYGEDLSGLPAFAARREAEHRGRVFDIGVAAMYCVAARREALEAVGPLDEAYGIGMFEDDDFAVRMRARGYRVACAEDAYVHHVGQGAFRRLSPADYDALWKRNQAYFEKKFGVEWRKHEPRDGVAAVASKVGKTGA